MIRQYLETKEFLKLNMYFTNNIIKLENHTSPINTYIDSFSWYLSPLVKTITSDIFMTSHDIDTSDKALTNSISSSRTSYRLEKSNFREQDKRFVRNEPYASSFFELNIRADQVKNLYTRKLYESVGDSR